MRRPTLFLTVGLPATGKTTAARRIETEQRALRLTKDEWVKALYGHDNPPSAQAVIEGHLIQVALRALALGTSVVIDFGLWSRDERTALRQAAADLGALVEIHYFALSPAEQRRRVGKRQAEASHTTWHMSDQELAGWAATFDIPTPGELDGSEPLDEPPAGFATWDEWRRHRWPPSVRTDMPDDPTPTNRAALLLALHAGPGFVLPNAWDPGSARILEQVGFPAIATTSAGIAWSCGVPDGGALDRDTMLEQVGRIVAAVNVPVTADLEAGYGDTADDVGRTVALAAQLGAAGCNLEDAQAGRLFAVDEAVDRVAAARAAAPAGTFVLNARTDTYFVGTAGDAFAETVERANRYAEAGADCVFVPGVVEADTIRRLAAAIPVPLNVVAGLANLIDAPTLFSLGVRRVSLGGSLARASLSLLERAGRELLDSGTLGFLDGVIGYADLQRRFGA